MTSGRQILKAAALLLGLSIAGEPTLALAGDGYMLATGRPDGKSFAVGVGISSLAKVKLQPLRKMDLSPVESSGFVENVRMLQHNDAQFAILQAMFGHFARTGTGTFDGEQPNDDVQAIAMLWRDADHFVINQDYVKTGTIADMAQLRGMSVSLGPDGPGPYDSNRLLLSHFGIDASDAFHLRRLNYRQSAQAIKDGDIKAMSTPIRPPAPHVQEALASTGDRYKLLEFTDDQIARADGGLGLWTRYIIPAATYPGQDRDIQTVAKSNLLVVRKDVDPEVVYEVTKAVFENLDFLRNIHDAMYETSIDRALVGIPMELHPGALRYFQEVGLLGPDTAIDVALAKNVKQAGVAAYNAIGGLQTLPAAGAAPVLAGAGDTREPPASMESFDGSIPGSRTFVVYFGLGEKEVAGTALQELAEIRAFADQLANASIMVSGHTDKSGDPVFNEYLAEIRANSVVDALRDIYGVAGHDIKIVNRGSEQPAIDDGREYQPRNRRVEITVAPAAQDQTIDAAEQPSTASPPSWIRRASI